MLKTKLKKLFLKIFFVILENSIMEKFPTIIRNKAKRGLKQKIKKMIKINTIEVSALFFKFIEIILLQNFVCAFYKF